MGVTYEPDHFDIRDIDGDGRAEILMRIETYNSEISPIPQAWRKRYGFKTNFIVIKYERGKLQVRDQDSYGKLIPPVGWRKELLENKEQ